MNKQASVYSLQDYTVYSGHSGSVKELNCSSNCG